MDYLTNFLIVVAVFPQARCRPEFPLSFHHSEGHELFQPHLGFHGFSEEHHEGFLSDTHDHTPHYHGPKAVPVVLPSGHLADTPAVAEAKAHHLTAVAQAKADKYYDGHADHNYGGAYGYSGSDHVGHAVPVVLPNGHLADTHEVAEAKSAHLLAVAHAKAEKYYAGHGEGYGYGGGHGYSGSYHGEAVPVVLPNGHLADTHEVAVAKDAHMTAVAHAKAQETHSEHHLEHEHLEPLSHLPHHGVSLFPHNEVGHLPLHHDGHFQHFLPHHEDHFGFPEESHSEFSAESHDFHVPQHNHLDYLDHSELFNH